MSYNETARETAIFVDAYGRNAPDTAMFDLDAVTLADVERAAETWDYNRHEFFNTKDPSRMSNRW